MLHVSRVKWLFENKLIYGVNMDVTSQGFRDEDELFAELEKELLE